MLASKLPGPVRWVGRRVRSLLRSTLPLGFFVALRRTQIAPKRRPTRRYLKQRGHRVQRGPWAGLLYDPMTARLARDVAAKLLGSYEEELHDVLAAEIQKRPRTFIDVGCAEGYHAVGAARALPEARVIAYDNDELDHRLCGRLARTNEVEDRVEVRTTFDLEAVAAVERPVLLLMDCEGCEVMLLRDDAPEALEDSVVIVELHDFAAPGIEEGLVEAFSPTHSVDIIRAESRYRAEYAELEQISRNDVELDLLVSERRPTRMAWAVMRPRGT